MKRIGLALALGLLAVSGNAFAEPKSVSGPLPGRLLFHVSPTNPGCGTLTMRLTRLPAQPHSGR
jgi:hypothetical protein